MNPIWGMWIIPTMYWLLCGGVIDTRYEIMITAGFGPFGDSLYELE